VCTWGPLTLQHCEPVFRQIAEAGYDGVEGLFCDTAEALVDMASSARTWGLDVLMVTARTPAKIIRYNAALGNDVCEIWEGLPKDFGAGDVAHEDRFPLVARFFEPLLHEAQRHHMRLCHHIHLGQLVVTMEHVDLLVRHLPQMGILLDTGHLIAAGGDPLRLLDEHADRIVHIHLKDFYRGSDKWDYRAPEFSENYFVPLGEGNAGLDVRALLQKLEQIGYDGWISCELDPLPSLMSRGLPVAELIRRNREYVRSCGY